MVLDEPFAIGAGGNSGFQAVNLAAQFGSRHVILVGFDMSVAAGVHWHPDHLGACGNPDVEKAARWRELMDAQAGALACAGITVVNASVESALAAYPKCSLEEAMNRCTVQFS